MGIIFFFIVVGIICMIVTNSVQEEARKCAFQQLNSNLRLGNEFKDKVRYLINYGCMKYYENTHIDELSEKVKQYFNNEIEKVLENRPELLSIYNFTKDSDELDKIINNNIANFIKEKKKSTTKTITPETEKYKKILESYKRYKDKKDNNGEIGNNNTLIGTHEIENFPVLKKISTENIINVTDIVKNILNKRIVLKENLNNKINSFSLAEDKYCLVRDKKDDSFATIHDYNFTKTTDIIQKISIYKINENKKKIEYYVKENTFIKELPPQTSNLQTTVYVEHINAEREDLKQSFPYSILMYNGTNLEHQATFQETNDKKGAYNWSFHNILIKNIDEKPLILDKISNYYVSENGINTELNIENNYYKYKLPVIWENNYFSLEDQRDKFCNLIIYNNDKILHYIKNINFCFTLSKRVNTSGEFLCEIFNDDFPDHNNTSIIRLNKDGSILNLSSSSKYKEMFDFIESPSSINLNFNLIDELGYVNIYFHKKECQDFYILDEFTQNADSKEVLKNKFDDDISINYVAKYDKDRILDLIFIRYILDKRCGSTLLTFNNGLYGTKLKNNFFAGTAIYGVPFLDYYKGLEGDFSYINTVSQNYLAEEQRDNFRMYVKNIYEKYNLEYNPNELPKEFIKNEISSDIFLNKLENFINGNNSYEIDYKTMKVYDQNRNELLDCKKLKEELKNKIIKQNKYCGRWKSEVELYNLVAKYFPNAIYQYHNSFLGMQSLDIFIPDLRIAIEYQGEQHYKSIDLFGGIEALNKRKELDEKKRKICKENDIKLIEWLYTEQINKHTLDKKIKSIIEKNQE